MAWGNLTKLHGSINWGKPTIAEEESDLVYQLPLNGGASIADFFVRTEFGSPFTLYFKPVIIPPILDKSFLPRNKVFKVLWNMAMEAIEEAEKITFVGYSLPTTDFMAEFMFRQAISVQSVERTIDIVDPRASKLEERFLDVFGACAPALEISFKDCDFLTYANDLLAATAQPVNEPTN